MNRIIAVLTFFVLMPCGLHGQDTTIEIGTGVGVNILMDGSTITSIGIPGPAIGAFGLMTSAPIYASFIYDGGMMFQPEVAIRYMTSDGESITMAASVANVGYLFNGADRNSPYFSANVAVQYVDVEEDSENDFAAGGAMGYRFIVNDGFALSLEAGYRRWFDWEVNEVTLGLRMGGVF